jgi:hypothetical protein
VTHLDPQSERRLQQLIALLRAELCKAGPDVEMVLRLRIRAGRIVGDSRVEHLVSKRLEAQRLGE